MVEAGEVAVADLVVVGVADDDPDPDPDEPPSIMI